MFKLVTENGLQTLFNVAGLKPHKASGPDQLPAKLVEGISIRASSNIHTSLPDFARPGQWKSVNVVPIYMKGDKSKPENYRPVSLSSITCTTLEHSVSSTIMKHMGRHSILTNAQHGFWRKKNHVRHSYYSQYRI